MYITPRSVEEAARVYGLLNEQGIPTFILGAGANILVSDLGIRAAVIDVSELQESSFDLLSYLRMSISKTLMPITRTACY